MFRRAKHIIHRGVVMAALLGMPGALSQANAQSEEYAMAEVRAELNKPITVGTRNGRRYVGNGKVLESGDLQVEARAGAGAVAYTFSPDDVVGIAFPGNDYLLLALEYSKSGRHAAAIPLFEAILAQREPFLGILSQNYTAPFISLIQSYLAEDEYYKAIGASRRLMPHIGDEYTRRALREAILLGHFEVGLFEDAKVQADEWIDTAGKSANSAVGWWVLGSISLREEDYEGALWTALQPIVFSSQLPMAYLDRAYALAIAASLELDLEDKAQTLHREMMSRNLTWPQGLHTEYRKQLESLNTQSSEPASEDIQQIEAVREQELKEASTTEDLREPSPLDAIRRTR